jgi:hypothetical protein
MSDRDPSSNVDDTSTRVRVSQSSQMGEEQQPSGSGGQQAQQAIDTATQKGQEVAGMAQEQGQQAVDTAKQQAPQGGSSISSGARTTGGGAMPGIRCAVQKSGAGGHHL